MIGQHIPEDVPAEEWERLSVYAVHVETLSASQGPSVREEEITQDSWRTLRGHFHDKPIFPNLRDLFWLIDDDGPERIIPFLSPTIDWLSVSCSTPSWEFTPDRAQEWQRYLTVLIDELSTRIPGLRHLTLSTCASIPSSFATSPLSKAPFIALSALDLYNADSLQPSDLVALSRITSLEVLELSVVDCQANLLHPARFDNLRDLRVYQQSATDRVFDIFTAPSLQRLDVRSFRVESTSDLRRMYALWARSFPALQELVCTLDEHDAAGMEPCSISSLVAPFCSIRDLRMLCLWLDTLPITIGDDDLSTFAEAWPSLETLIIQGSSDLAQEYYVVGLPGLIALTGKCPHLRDLRLSGVRVRSEDVAQLPRDSPVNRFRYLLTGYSTLS